MEFYNNIVSKVRALRKLVWASLGLGSTVFYTSRLAEENYMHQISQRGTLEKKVICDFLKDATRDARILEIGVGTGVYFDCYSQAKQLTGIDVSGPMLQIARRKLGQVSSKVPTSLIEVDIFTFRPALELGRRFDLIVCFGLFGYQRKLTKRSIERMLLYASQKTGDSPIIVLSVFNKENGDKTKGRFPVTKSKLKKLRHAMPKVKIEERRLNVEEMDSSLLLIYEPPEGKASLSRGT